MVPSPHSNLNSRVGPAGFCKVSATLLVIDQPSLSKFQFQFIFREPSTTGISKYKVTDSFFRQWIHRCRCIRQQLRLCRGTHRKQKCSNHPKTNKYTKFLHFLFLLRTGYFIELCFIIAQFLHFIQPIANFFIHKHTLCIVRSLPAGLWPLHFRQNVQVQMGLKPIF